MPLTPFNLTDLLSRTDEREPDLFVAWGHSGGFGRLVAFDPVEQLSLSAKKESEIEAFIQRHQGKLIAFLLSYDLGLSLYGLPSKHPSLPRTGYLAAYANWIRFPKEEEPVLAFADTKLEERIEAITARRVPRGKKVRCSLEAGLPLSAYRPLFESAQEYIRQGDLYQLNLTQKIRGHYPGPSSRLFLRLLATHPSRFAGFFSTPGLDLLSASPESFLESQGPVLYSQPIKGTRPQGANEAEEQKELHRLLTSKKEEAELFMITDLLRNDLAKSCRPGTVQVTKQKEVLRLKGVLHSYAEVKGHLQKGVRPMQALLRAFPGGSVTGCPKKRALEIIDELETSARGYYTGSFGYLDPKGGLHAAILIRSLFKQGDSFDFHVGGGITLLSELEAEFTEMEHKKNSIFKGLNE